MRLIALIALLVLLLAQHSAADSDSVTVDGTWWQGLADFEKLRVVEGEIDASEMAPFLLCKDCMRLTYSRRLGDYVDAIDAFYANNPKSLDMPVASVVVCLSDQMRDTPCTKWIGDHAH